MKLESGAMSPALRGLATRASLASIEALGLEARGDRLSAAVRWVEAAATGRELARRLLNGSNFTGAGVEYAAAWEQALHAGDPRLAEAVEFEFRQQSAIYRALKPALAEASGRLRAPTRKSLERFTQIFGRLRNLRIAAGDWTDVSEHDIRKLLDEFPAVFEFRWILLRKLIALRRADECISQLRDMRQLRDDWRLTALLAGLLIEREEFSDAMAEADNGRRRYPNEQRLAILAADARIHGVIRRKLPRECLADAMKILDELESNPGLTEDDRVDARLLRLLCLQTQRRASAARTLFRASALAFPTHFAEMFRTVSEAPSPGKLVSVISVRRLQARFAA